MFERSCRVFLLLALLSTPALQAEEADRVRLCLDTQPAGLQICLQSEVQPLPLNQMHRWLIEVQDVAGAPLSELEISVAGGMPQHNHGLPTAPQVRAAETSGHYWLEGMRFHMGGEWTLELEVLHAGRRYRATTVVLL